MDRCPDCPTGVLIWRCGRHICSNAQCATAAISADNVFQLRPRPHADDLEPDPPARRIAA